jgi:sulfur dioxygenase
VLRRRRAHPGEFQRHRIAGAHLLPLQELASRQAEIGKTPDKTIVFICEHGVRSAKACSVLMKAGWSKCANMSGGMAEWLDCGLPVNSGDEPDAESLKPPQS